MLNIESGQKSYTIVILAAISSTLLLGTISTISTNLFAAKFSATLSGNNEVPPVDTKATGTVSYRTAANETVIKYKVNITGFSDATGAHIHMEKAGANGDVIVDLLKDSKKNPTKLGMAIRGNITDSDLTGPMQGKTLSDLISAINSGDTYTNVHTAGHPDGEIRGQIESGSGNAGISSSNQTATVTITHTGNSTNSTS